jgi:osmotically-inducible protein OsmY
LLTSVNTSRRRRRYICFASKRHPELGPSGQLQVATLNRVVYLYGNVANDLQLAVANSVASQAGGDAKIVSSIAVSEK